MSKKSLRERILRKHGYVRTETGLQTTTVIKDPSGRKTLSMLLLEQVHGRTIEDLLTSGTGSEVAKILGISRFLVSQWKSRLGLNNGHKE